MGHSTVSKDKDAIKKLENNKEARKDGVGTELIKMGPDNLTTCLHQLIVKIWKTELPEERKEVHSNKPEFQEGGQVGLI